MNPIYDFLGGRKNALAVGVCATLLVFVGEGRFAGTHLTVALVAIAVVAIAYSWLNVEQKGIIAKNGDGNGTAPKG